MIAILLIPASLTFTFGYILGSKKQGIVIFAAMLILFSAGLFTSIYSEYQHYDNLHSEYNMEGKETRFGIMNSIIWSTATTAASNGSVNAMHSSLTPVSGMVAMLNIMLGEIIFGGIGSGMYGMLIFVFITVFISGLMVGRTPEYLGKKIESLEIKMSIFAILLPAAVILLFTAGSVCNNNVLKSISVSGPHGFSEILYAFSSAAGNNGSAFAGLNSNTDYLNIMTAIAMIIGRYGVIIPVMIIAGSIAKKNIVPESAGTFKTDNTLFVILLCLVILIVGGLTFFPALSLGPIVEHIYLMEGYGF
jgi:K+-transporting ATPase ATPase A chain